jgi:putative oxidoreductase
MMEASPMANRPLSSVSGTFARDSNIALGTESTLTGIIVVAGRALFVLVFILASPRLFLPASVNAAAQHGVPLAQILVPVSGVLAGLGGLSILLGYRAKMGAWLIAIFLLVVTPIMHNFWAVADPAIAQAQMINFLKNVAMLGGALLITQFGAGPWSLDARRK